MHSTLRSRLTLWYVGAFSVALILFSTGVYFLVDRILRERVDSNLRLTLQTTKAALANYVARKPLASFSDLRGLTEASSLDEAFDDPRFPGQSVAVLRENQILATRPAVTAFPVRLPNRAFRPSPRPQFYELSESNSEADNGCRGIYQSVSAGTGMPVTIVVTESMEPLSDQLDALQNALAVAVILALLLGGSGGWMLAHHSLSPLAEMASAIEHITACKLDERLPPGPKDELGRLAARFNGLLSRLQTSFLQQRQFMADASHEIRTPLFVLRTAAQVALQRPERSNTEYREALGLIERQAGRLSRLVDDMFALTRADMHQLPLEMSELYLEEVIADTISSFQYLAQQKGVLLGSSMIEEAFFQGDERLLRQMISNLLDNAIKFTPSGGQVELRLRQANTDYEITITDTGCGIPAELQPRVFERFFRVDKARTRGNGLDGAGLGLAIARSVAELHNGRLVLQRSGADGSTFCVLLPCCSTIPTEPATEQVVRENPSTGSAPPFL